MRNTTAGCGRKVSRAVVPTIPRVLFRCCSVVGKWCLYLRTAVDVQEEMIAKFFYNYHIFSNLIRTLYTVSEG